MPLSEQQYYTVDEVLAFPEDGNRYELIYGDLVVSPTPRMWHQVVVTRLAYALYEYCERERCGVAFAVPGDLSWGRTDLLINPDVFVIGLEELQHGDWSKVRNVMLVAEVLSPSTAHHDRFGKRLAYRDQRVGMYWIVDADAEFVEMWTPEASFPVIERERLTWNPPGASAPLKLELRTLFARPTPP